MRKILSIFFITIIVTHSLCGNIYAANYDTFTPYYGYVSTYSSNGVRYAYSETKWNSQGLTEFDSSIDTYEQQILFYNYDGTAYASSCSSYQSDLPSNYLDTQVLDGNSEYNIAVGTYSATSIEADTLYTTVFTLTGYNSQSSMYKISSQEGYKIVNASGLVFGETTSITIPYKNYNSKFVAPETRRWYYESGSNNTTSTGRSTHVNYWNGGSLSSATDVDYWTFSGTGTKEFVWQFGPGNSVVTKMQILNSSGTVLKTITASKDTTETYTFSSGTYYFKIYTTSSSSTESASQYYFVMLNQ